ncbi:CHAD domain-containing protein [Vulcanimicrobium alpinum]|uniref:CHAD domain-containing protein n=1 Tax=Vulcanimicrobium alpinum TaxID=3016050 RepID=A0AAN1XXA2_UNVUL|nr:CYTH and CHAD domain-containing protein [Vulcanimicrobium alpinum]BDE06640.1 CHAD domain-containing protein [Vulcanimicrobium alpinum]
MHDSIERERKLELPDGFSLARLDARWEPYVASPVEWERLHTVYYDTADLRLTRWGCSLRYRRGEGWTLKLPVPGPSDALRREEHVFAGDGRTVPAAAIDVATAYLRGAVVRPVAELRTIRTRRRVLCDGEELADVVEDDVRVVEGPTVVRRFRELEIELAQTAGDDLLDDLTAHLQAEGAGAADPTPKNVRALGPPAREPEIVSRHPGRRVRAGELALAAIAASVERLIRIDARLRLAPGDEEAVHQARVAVRRLRSDLRTFVPVFEAAWARELREALKWLGDGLAAARDADVMLARIGADLGALPPADRYRGDALLAGFRQARETAHARVRAMLREPRYVALLDTLVEATKRPQFNPCAADAARDVLRPLMRDAWSELRRAVRKRTRPPKDRELHRIRIKAKRVRYAAEAFAPVAGKRARRFGKRAERLQTVLGEQHDATIAQRLVRTEAQRAEASFAAGAASVLEGQAAARARGAWRRAWGKVRRFYRRWTAVARP